MHLARDDPRAIDEAQGVGLLPLEDLILLISELGVVHYRAILGHGTYKGLVNPHQLLLLESEAPKVYQDPKSLPEASPDSLKMCGNTRTVGKVETKQLQGVSASPTADPFSIGVDETTRKV